MHGIITSTVEVRIRYWRHVVHDTKKSLMWCYSECACINWG